MPLQTNQPTCMEELVANNDSYHIANKSGTPTHYPLFNTKYPHFKFMYLQSQILLLGSTQILEIIATDHGSRNFTTATEANIMQQSTVIIVLLLTPRRNTIIKINNRNQRAKNITMLGHGINQTIISAWELLDRSWLVRLHFCYI